MDLLAKLNNWNFTRKILTDFDIVDAEEKTIRFSIDSEESKHFTETVLQFKKMIPIISFYTQLFNKLIISLSKSRNVTVEQYRETHLDQIKSISESFYRLTINMQKIDITLSKCVHELFDGTKVTPKNKIYEILYKVFCHSLDTRNDKVTTVDMLRFYVDDELDHIMTIEQYFLKSDEIKCKVYKELTEIEKFSTDGFFDECFLIDHEFDPFTTMYNKIHTIIGNTKYLYKKTF